MYATARRRLAEPVATRRKLKQRPPLQAPFALVALSDPEPEFAYVMPGLESFDRERPSERAGRRGVRQPAYDRILDAAASDRAAHEDALVAVPKSEANARREDVK